MKKLVLIGLLISMFQSNAQNYSPKTPGSKWLYKMPEGTFEDRITTEKLTHKGFVYFQSVRTYSLGAIDTSYFRTEKSGAVYYLDPKSLKESIDIPSNPKPSFKWKSSDGDWSYEIMSTNETFVTPEKTFKDCLVIKAEQLTGRDEDKFEKYLNYYSKDIGYIGSKANDELMSYLVEWELK